MNLRRVVGMLGILLGCLLCVQADRVRVQDNLLVDSQGRQVLHHGINVVVKSFPWHPVVTHYEPPFSMSAHDIELFKSWGFNVVRLGIMWPGVEPAPGQYNHTYLNLMRKLVDDLGEAGIYTLLDFHQDNLGARWCGEGIPEWAADIAAKDAGVTNFPWPLQKDPYQTGANGIPVAGECGKYSWAEYYLTQGQGAAWHALYKNHSGLVDHLGGFWQVVAETFRTSEWVLGYELINEPWAGDALGNLPWNLDILFPGHADRHNLQPFYDSLATYLRRGDPDAVIFFESVTFDDMFPVGFTSIPGGPEYADRSVLSYHYYQAINFEGRKWHWATRMNDIKRLGIGGMLTEFAIYRTIPIFEQTAAVCDATQQGWIAWDHSEIYEGKNPNMAKVQAASRTYAKRVAGRIQEMTYNETSHDFYLSYVTGSAAVGAPTMIFLNEELNYPSGFKVQVTVNPSELGVAGPAWKSISDNHILVTTPSTISANSVITIRVTPNVPGKKLSQPSDDSTSAVGPQVGRFNHKWLLQRVVELVPPAYGKAVADHVSKFMNAAASAPEHLARGIWETLF